MQILNPGERLLLGVFGFLSIVVGTVVLRLSLAPGVRAVAGLPLIATGAAILWTALQVARDHHRVEPHRLLNIERAYLFPVVVASATGLVVLVFSEIMLVLRVVLLASTGGLLVWSAGLIVGYFSLWEQVPTNASDSES